MKTSIPALAILLGWAAAAWATAPGTLTTLREIHTLTNAQAAKTPAVAFEATVTYFRDFENTLFVQDGDVGIFVAPPTGAGLRLLPGDRVLVLGSAHSSFNPYITGKSITLLHHGDLPKPAPASFDELIHAKADCRMVTVRGVVRAADFMTPANFTYLQLLTNGGYFNATVDGKDGAALEEMLDAEVELTGVASETFDSKMQMTGILIHVQTPAGVKVLKRSETSPWSLPLVPMDRVLSVFHVNDSTARERVHGTITYYEPGATVILQDGKKSVWVETQTRSALHVGDVADATGFPEVHEGFLHLVHGEVRDSHQWVPVMPLPATWKTLTPNGNRTPGHHFDLVSIEGKVETQVQEASQDEYVLHADGQLFSAIYRHPDGPPAFNKRIPLGSRVRVTGICVLEGSNPFVSQVPFNILMRSPDDISIIAAASPFSVRNLVYFIGILFICILVVGARGWIIERKVRRQTASLAYVERRRSRILEDINGARPFAAIIEQITELTSCKLDGAACWCQIADGARLGNCPPKLTAFRVVHQDIHAHSGSPLGTIFAAFDPLSTPRDLETEALSMATALSKLAIETRRLYSDLVHRSEFDQLTNTRNRFSLDKRLDALVAEARETAGIFGLIYIDLDKFKQINDLYGHPVGDWFLQEVALRLKSQLRSHDLLARLGGDEFAVLVPVVRSRAEVEEIAERLERCLDEPFYFEELTLQGSVSLGIAVYPEDGASKDILLKTADAAMYAAKNSRRRDEQVTTEPGIS
jgi:diguanylate cyclase (GGDEF)-like protein